jgi:sodium/bile acid cotransporter 3/5
MTTLSTILAFFSIPLWMVIIGPVLFEKAHIDSDTNIKLVSFAAGLLIPLIIGVLLQKFLPKVAAFILRIFKPVAAFFMIFIIVLAMVIYWYLFFIFSWEVRFIAVFGNVILVN